MKTLGKLKLKEEKMLNHEELLGFRGGSGASGSGCAGYGVNKCSANCQCESRCDWWFYGLSQSRPLC